jgi:hypothetical protein
LIFLLKSIFSAVIRAHFCLSFYPGVTIWVTGTLILAGCGLTPHSARSALLSPGQSAGSHPIEDLAPRVRAFIRCHPLLATTERSRCGRLQSDHARTIRTAGAGINRVVVLGHPVTGLTL